MRAIFLSRESEWSAAARVRGGIWKDALSRCGVDCEILCLESLFALPRRTNYSRWFKVYLAFKTARILLNRPYDLLVINKINYHTLGAVFSCMLKRKKFILDIDDWEYRTKEPGKKTVFQRLGDHWARQARLVVVASVFLRDYFHFCPRLAYVPSCPALPLSQKARAPSADMVFGWMGMIDRPDVLESVRAIIEAFVRVRRTFPRTKLVIVGKGIFLRELQEIARQYARENIQFQYDVAADDLPRFIQSITAGILLFKENDIFYQAKSPTRLFHFFFYGKPVIASAVGECAIYVKQDVNGYLVKDPLDLARCMEAFCDGGSTRVRLSRGAFVTAQQWNRDVLSEQLSRTVSEVVCV